MFRSKGGLLGVAAALALLTLPAAAAAETITIGANLGTAVYANAFGCNVLGGCTDAQTTSNFLSPITGTIIRWRVRDSSGPLTMRTVAGQTGGTVGPTATPKSSAIETFAAALPIKAGEAIGVDLGYKTGSDIGLALPGGTTLPTWAPILEQGETRAPDNTYNQFELLLNADVQPPPGIAALAPAAGPFGGGTPVTISGHDFIGASSVRFGATPATAFQVDSDTQITALSPPGPPGVEALAVTTLAGTATASFAYQAAATPCYPAAAGFQPAPAGPHLHCAPGQREEAAGGEANSAPCRLQDRQGVEEAWDRRANRPHRQATAPGRDRAAGGDEGPRQAWVSLSK